MESKKGGFHVKKVIYGVGILFLAIIILLNVIFTANIDVSEHVIINWNNLLYILGVALLGVFLFWITKAADKHLYATDAPNKRKARKILLIVAVTIYTILSIAWIIFIRPGIGGDQVHTCNLAQTFYRGNDEEFLPNMTYAGIPLVEYMQAYGQQATLAFVFSIIFRIIHFDQMEILRGLNVICNLLTIFALYKINRQISKKYQTNRVLLFTLILTFLTLPMLATFIYGDIPSLMLCLFSVYFTMKYAGTRKWGHFLAASALSMLAYMMRMNSLIFVIATVIYLGLTLLKGVTKKHWRENLVNIFIIVAYIAISVVPSSLVKNYYMNKYDLDTNKAIPTINYIYMATMEGPRANGWYSEEIGEYAIRNPEKAKEEYKEKWKERLTYFSQNIGYTVDFYTMKIASMWAETTYSALNNNGIDESYGKPLEFYQKALLLITCVCSLTVLIQNRKNLSLEVLFLITIFIGGFAFHILWEAKSRYIIPYVVVLIPVATISIRKWKVTKAILTK